MTQKPTDINALNIVIAEDGTATLSGINYQDLRSLFTAARLYRYAHPFKPKPLDGRLDDDIHASNMENARWHLQQHLIHDVLDARVLDAIEPRCGGGANKIASAMESFELALRRLDADIRRAEAEAADVANAKQPDPLDEITAILQAVAREANGAVAKVSQLRNARAQPQQAPDTQPGPRPGGSGNALTDEGVAAMIADAVQQAQRDVVARAKAMVSALKPSSAIAADKKAAMRHGFGVCMRHVLEGLDRILDPAFNEPSRGQAQVKGSST